MLLKKLKAEWFRLYLFAMCCISFLNMLHSESIAISKKIQTKKAWTFIQAFSYSVKVTNQNWAYFFFEVRRFKSTVTPKLTTAPIKAKTIVFKTSAEVKLGITLNANPPKVPAFKVKELSIRSNVSFGLNLIFFVGFIVYRNLAYCR